MNKALVVYFSATGKTRRIAKNLAIVAKSDVCEIAPKQPYTSSDLNWMDTQSRTSLEAKNPEERPEFVPVYIEMSAYDTIYLGFPVWWYSAPPIVNTFLESHNFSEKKIIVFASSGGSGFGKTLKKLKLSVDESVTWVESEIINWQCSKEKLADFIEKYH